MGLRSIRLGGGGLTAAILLEAEMAPTARVDCRRAFRNILKIVLDVTRVEGMQLHGELQLRGGEIQSGEDEVLLGKAKHVGKLSRRA